MSNYQVKVFRGKEINQNEPGFGESAHIGRAGDLMVDPYYPQAGIHISDGETPGGIAVGGSPLTVIGVGGVNSGIPASAELVGISVSVIHDSGIKVAIINTSNSANSFKVSGSVVISNTRSEITDIATGWTGTSVLNPSAALASVGDRFEALVVIGGDSGILPRMFRITVMVTQLNLDCIAGTVEQLI